MNLLSFGEEAEEDEKDLATVMQKIKSSHDVLNDPRLLKEQNPAEEMVIILLSIFFDCEFVYINVDIKDVHTLDFAAF